MKTVILIPARYASVRFPGKPLALLHGKPMILWVAERSAAALPTARVVVATDDERIREVVSSAGCEVVMTKSGHPSGSDRIQEAATNLGLNSEDLVVNVQGDEPLVKAEWLRALIQPFSGDSNLQMSTLAHRLSAEELSSPNAVKVLVNCRSEAIYFSRYSIPFSRLPMTELGLDGSVLKHMGFYAYRKSFLDRFCETPPSFSERGECLEQLRALEMGERIYVARVAGKSLGVDTPEDLVKIQAEWPGVGEKSGVEE